MKAKVLKKNFILYAGLAVSCVALACFFPLSGDDWQWATTFGFSKFNGRYLGNLFAQLLTQNLWLKPIFVGLSMFFIMLSTALITARKSPLLSVFLIILTPTAIFTSVFQWTSGFSNYALPVVFLLGNLLIFHFIPSMKGAVRKAMYIPALGIAFATQLFVEHITIFTVAFSVIFFLCGLLREKKVNLFVLVCVAGYIAGAAVMFSNGAYSSAGHSSAHSMPEITQMLNNAYGNYFDFIAPHLILGNLWMNLVIAALLIRLIRKSSRKNSHMDTILQGYFILFSIYSIFRVIHSTLLTLEKVKLAEGVVAASFCIALILTVAMYVPKGAAKTKMYFIFLALTLVSAPLFPVDPIGARCFFVTYALFAIFTGILYGYMENADMLSFDKTLIKRLAASVALCAFIGYFAVYGSITLLYRSRQNAIDEQRLTGNEAIAIRIVPYAYVWQGNPTTEYLDIIYKSYYKIPNDCRLEFIYPELV